MKKSQKRWFALQITAPALIAFGFALYHYTQNYSLLYSKPLVGPITTLCLFVFGAYAVTLYPKTLHDLRSKTPAQVRHDNWLKIFYYHLPIALLIVTFVVGWMYFTRWLMKWAAGAYFPGLEGLMFLLGLLMPGQEVMKYLERRPGLRAYIGKNDPEQAPLKLTEKQLKVLIIGQSLLFLTLAWLAFAIATSLLLSLVKNFLSAEWIIILIIFTYTPIIVGLIKLELRFEKWGRDHLYIPWSSN
ncbi:MAG: hypothetical protein KTR30_27255 [Saprospiraceae bacterium]|nr:hypothetical protein [Saprospiraceae bacterium]